LQRSDGTIVSNGSDGPAMAVMAPLSAMAAMAQQWQ
jgi:hypothetical protein